MPHKRANLTRGGFPTPTCSAGLSASILDWLPCRTTGNSVPYSSDDGGNAQRDITSRTHGSIDRNGSGASKLTLFTLPDSPMETRTVTLPWVNVLSRNNARW